MGGGLSTGDGEHTPRSKTRCSSSTVAVFSLLEEDYPWTVPLEAKMMVLLDTIQVAEMGGKKPGPISGRHDGITILGPDQLADVACRDYTNQVVQRADVGPPKLPLDEAERRQGRTWCGQ